MMEEREKWEENLEEIRHYGRVRGGSNTFALFHLHILPPEGSIANGEEAQAVFERWDEEFGLKGLWCWRSWWYPINTRREFSLIPAIIRKALRLGYDVGTSMSDVGPKGLVRLGEDPAAFWRIVALAQMFYKE